MRIFSWIVGVPVAAVVVMFAVSNRQVVEIELFPLPYTADVPLYAAVLTACVVTFVLGGFFAWASGAPVRRENRKKNKRIKELEKQLAAFEKDSPAET